MPEPGHFSTVSTHAHCDFICLSLLRVCQHNFMKSDFRHARSNVNACCLLRVDPAGVCLHDSLRAAVGDIVREKELRLREGMSMLGEWAVQEPYKLEDQEEALAKILV